MKLLKDNGMLFIRFHWKETDMDRIDWVRELVQKADYQVMMRNTSGLLPQGMYPLDTEYTFIIKKTHWAVFEDETKANSLGEVAEKIKNSEKIVIIKSTSLPGTTKKMAKKYPHVNFVMNPEFLTQKNASADFLNPVRTVIGSDDEEVAGRVVNLYKTILNKDQKYIILDPTSAELTKYMSNLMLASKIMLANEFYFLAEKVGANYDEVRKAVEADPRIGTFLRVPGWDGEFGFGQACFPKDMVGILGLAKKIDVDMPALKAIWDENLKIRKHRDWEEMPQAFKKK